MMNGRIDGLDKVVNPFVNANVELRIYALGEAPVLPVREEGRWL